MTYPYRPNSPAPRPGRGLPWSVSILFSLLLFLACSTACKHVTAAQEPRNTSSCIGSLFDVSMSAAAEPTKNGYLRDFAKIVAGLQAGDLVIADTITENPSATMTFPVRVPLPAYDAWQTNPLLHRQDMDAAKQSLIDQTTTLVRRTPATKKTAILDALYVTHKAFDSRECREAGHRVLVVFSDMEEDSERDNFLLDNLTTNRIEALLRWEQHEAHLPDLRDVDVWIAGATPERTLGPGKIRSIEAFWMAYFARTGAKLKSDHYGPALLNFALPRER